MMASAEALTEYCLTLARGARAAATALATAPGRERDRALVALADGLHEERAAILSANAEDLADAREKGLASALIDRLRLDDKRLGEMAQAIHEIAAMPDPLGRVLESSVRPNGLEVRKVSVPLGVVLFLYESRPNVTTDAAALCLKSGNAVILRGGKEARRSNLAIGRAIHRALATTDLPPAAVTMVDVPEREAVGALLALDAYIDVAIPRGGEDLIRRVAREAKMPVLKHYKGVCHVYVDGDADRAMALEIVENAKCQRPAVCNAAETLLVHAAIAPTFLPELAQRLRHYPVELRGCPRTCALLGECRPAVEEDFGCEFLDLILAVKIVDDLEAAVDHIRRYGSGHTEAIVTESLRAAQRFVQAVDASAVMVNASTRFNDGGQLGLGAEIGISTDKLHARGPCGLRELTSTKWIVFGQGQVRR